MKFLIDAQLPRRLSHRLQSLGYDSVHTLDLPRGNGTSDATINQLSIDEERIVITKDGDFVHSLLSMGVPFKLLLVSTGNINNSELEQILVRNLPAIIEGFGGHRFLEINRATLLYRF